MILLPSATDIKRINTLYKCEGYEQLPPCEPSDDTVPPKMKGPYGSWINEDQKTCQELREIGACNNDYGYKCYMKKHCRHTCGWCDSQLGIAGCKDRSPERCTKDKLDCKGDQERGDIPCKKTCGLCGKEFELKPRCLRWNDRSDPQHTSCLLNITSNPSPLDIDPPQPCLVERTRYDGTSAFDFYIPSYSAKSCANNCALVGNCTAWSYKPKEGLKPSERGQGVCFLWASVTETVQDDDWVSGCLPDDTAETTTAVNSPTSTVPTTTVATGNELPAAPCQHNGKFYVGLKFGNGASLESPRACDERCRRDPQCQLWDFDVNPNSQNYKLCFWWNDATGATLVENRNYVAGCLPGETANLPAQASN